MKEMRDFYYGLLVVILSPVILPCMLIACIASVIAEVGKDFHDPNGAKEYWERKDRIAAMNKEKR
ncbi:unnamed protein product [marine sediment metagenome]|uniref:Uncharacterized protein n=1 Tax=marine sediment metagenome TaxID=412755 RepID=X1SLR0_9ZZZZ